MTNITFSTSLSIYTANEKAEAGRWNGHMENFLHSLYRARIIQRSVIVRHAWRRVALTFTFFGAPPGSVNIPLLHVSSGFSLAGK